MVSLPGAEASVFSWMKIQLKQTLFEARLRTFVFDLWSVFLLKKRTQSKQVKDQSERLSWFC